MEQKDYLKRQIDELGQVLGKLLTDLLHLKNENKFSEGIELANQILKTSLDHNLEELLAIPDKDFVSTLKSRKIKNDGLEKLAELLLVVGDQEGPTEKGKSVYKKSFLLFEKLESVESIYSMDRHRKIERLKKILS